MVRLITESYLNISTLISQFLVLITVFLTGALSDMVKHDMSGWESRAKTTKEL